MKPANEWDEEYIYALPMGEFDWLEVKGRRGIDLTLSNIKESDALEVLSKEISAFANTGGGLLLYGMKDPRKVGKWEVDDGGIEMSSPKGDLKEWLEDVIPHQVDFSLTNFNVYAIQASKRDSEIQAGRALYLIEIQDSLQAPHQAKDKKYYVRVAGKSVPIGHRLVADIMGRRQNPYLEIDFWIEENTERPTKSQGHTGVNTSYSLWIRAQNTGRVYANYVNCFIDIPWVLLNNDQLKYIQDQIRGKEYYTEYFDNTIRDLIDVKVTGFDSARETHGPARFVPILPSRSRTWRIELSDALPDVATAKQVIKWSLFADNSPSTQGELTFESIERMESDEA